MAVPHAPRKHAADATHSTEAALWCRRNDIYNTPAMSSINKLVRLIRQGCGECL